MLRDYIKNPLQKIKNDNNQWQIERPYKEDLYEKYPIACDLNADGLPENPNYNLLIAPMLKLIQEQHEDIESLKEKIENLKCN